MTTTTSTTALLISADGHPSPADLEAHRQRMAAHHAHGVAVLARISEQVGHPATAADFDSIDDRTSRIGDQ